VFNSKILIVPGMPKRVIFQNSVTYVDMLYDLYSLLSSVSKNHVVVTSLRRAQYSMYNMFNTLTLLSRGRIVYHGPAGEDAIDHFKDNGR